MKRLILGLCLTVAVAALLGMTQGWAVGAAGAGFGLLATGLHLAAVRLLQPALGAPLRQLAVRASLGMALRLGGVAVWLVAVLTAPKTFPVLPTAGAYLGVLIPLLLMETRFLR